MKILLALITLQLFFYQSCATNKTRANPDARKVVEDFYNWYIDTYKNVFDYYQVPPFKKTGTTEYIFDKDTLSQRLNKIKYISEKYKANLLDKLELCNNEMKKKKWDYEPEPQFNISQCNYLWFDNWVGGQGENIDGFNIISEVDNQSSIEFVVEILIKKKVFTKSKVTVEKEKNTYKVLNIELVWD